MEIYDLVVAGLGAVGCSAVLAAAKRGLKVCGIEQYPFSHDRGSSHGESRIIRKAYFLHPDYIPLLNRSYALWEQLQAEAAEELLCLNGLICAGEPDGPLIRGLETCYSTHLQLPHERMTPAQAMKRWPTFHLPESCDIFYDPEGGFLRADRCLETLKIASENLGATLRDNEPILEWNSESTGSVLVKTALREISCAKLVVTTGAWIAPRLKPLGIQLRAKRKALFWYSMNSPEAFQSDRFPCYICKVGGNEFYGFPTLDGQTVKCAEDSGGQWLDDPEAVDRSFLEEDETNLRLFLDNIFPGAIGERQATKTCIYTLSVDRNFILGQDPNQSSVVLGSCCSGHGFKLAPAMGEALVETAVNGRVPETARFLEFGRFVS